MSADRPASQSRRLRRHHATKSVITIIISLSISMMPSRRRYRAGAIEARRFTEVRWLDACRYYEAHARFSDDASDD